MGGQLTICNLYLHPGENASIRDVTDLISQLPEPMILLGDFNAQHTLWGCRTVNRLGRLFETVITNTDLCILNTGDATHFHVQTGTSSAIDLTFCSPALRTRLTWRVLGDPCGSDHYPILIEDCTPPLPDGGERRFNVKKAKWKIFNHRTQIPIPHHTVQTEELVEFFTRNLIQAAETSIPKCGGRGKHRKVPWWSDDITEVNLERRQTLLRYQHTKLDADKISYKRIRARAKFVKNEARRSSWREYVSTITKETPMSKIWSRIGKMNGKYPSHHPPYLRVAGVDISEGGQVANVLAEHFSAVSSTAGYSQEFQRIKARRESVILDFSTDEHLNYNEPITAAEVEGMLRQCEDSAPGSDAITYSMLKNMHESSLALLLTIYNRLYIEGGLPRAWRHATVLAFHKPGRTPTDPASYRPIALTSCVGKLLEKIINVRLMKYLETQNLLSRFQYGYRKMLSTNDPLMKLQTDILKAFSNKEHLICIFLDLRKAFDTAWRYGILKAVHDATIRGPLAYFIRNFLQDRRFVVKVGQFLSEQQTQEEGVPQGSVLSCTLFLLAINNIIKDLPPHVKASMYVDDVVIYSSSAYIPALERRLQTALTKIDQLTLEQGWDIAADKTHGVHFHRKRSQQPMPTLFIRNQVIQFKEEMKFLGVIFDRKLNWNSHLTYLKENTLKKLDILKSLSRKTWGSDRVTMLRLYRALIRSKLDYGSIVYISAGEALKKLDPVHNAAIRLCIGAFRSSPVVSLYAESGEAPLSIRRQSLVLQYYVRVKQNPRNPAYDSIHERWPELPNRREPLPLCCRIPLILQDIDMADINVTRATLNDDPIWQVNSSATCKGFQHPKKSESHAGEMQTLFASHFQSEHLLGMKIYTDGSKSGLSVGYAAVAEDAIFERKLPPAASIFTAELSGIRDAMSKINESNEEVFTIFTDSRSCIDAINIYNNPHPIVVEIMSWLIKHQTSLKRVQVCWVPGHADVAGNERADEAARRAAAAVTVPYTNHIPYKDYYPVIKARMREKWQERWTEVVDNKLRSIKDTVRPWISSEREKRQTEVSLARLRIGHTLITHGYLMEGGRRPECDDCHVPLTVMHFMAECPNYEVNRTRCWPVLRNIPSPEERLKHQLAEMPGCSFDIAPLERYLKMLDIYDKL